jgi:signal transduction histidine kinase
MAMLRKALPTPPNRIAGWVAPGLVAAFAIVGALQTHRLHPATATVAVAVTIVGVALMAPSRPVLRPAFALLSAAGVVFLCHANASNVGWFAICILGGWSAFVVRTRVTIGLLVIATLGFGLEWLYTVDDAGWAAWIAGTSCATLGSLLGRRERDLVQQLRIAQAGLAERVRAEERNHIARELHDVIAHSLTVSLLHVSSARLAVEEDPASAIQALAEAERLGRVCLAEVRQVVGLLRPGEGGTTPLPGTTHLAALVDQFRGAGADVVFNVDGDPAELPSTVGLAIYRILQEALTNAARHAPGAPTKAGLSVTPTRAVLTVDSAGAPGSGTGGGLLSMRERADVLGGRCTAGPTATGWQVRVELPRQPTAQSKAYQ